MNILELRAATVTTLLNLFNRNMDNSRIESCQSNDLVQLEHHSNDHRMLNRNMNNYRIESCRSNDLVQLEYNSNDYCMFIRNINNPRIESCQSNDFLFNLNTIATTIVCLIVT